MFEEFLKIVFFIYVIISVIVGFATTGYWIYIAVKGGF